MKNYICLFCISLLSTSSFCQTNKLGFNYFFKRTPKPTAKVRDLDKQELAATSITPTTQNLWKPTVIIPALRLVPTTASGASLNALLLTSTGGGISWQHQVWDSIAKKWNTTISLSPATFLLSGNFATNSTIDFSYGMTIGVFNNLFMFGGGYDFGSVTGNSHFFGLLSIGINLTNN